jgi:predicted O-methyltransferase YrrM
VSAQATTDYVEGYLQEDEPLLMARRNAADVGGAPPVSAATGAALRFIAAALTARSVVEIGTGCGTSGIWLLRGMRADGVLTSVDVDPEHQRLARKAFTEAGFAANRYRLIGGKAADVLPRLTDGAYDLVFCDADRREDTEYLIQALRLLRPGGVLAVAGILINGLAADPAARNPEIMAIRELATAVRDDARLTPMLLNSGDGLLVAAVARSFPVG